MCWQAAWWLPHRRLSGGYPGVDICENPSCPVLKDDWGFLHISYTSIKENMIKRKPGVWLVRDTEIIAHLRALWVGQPAPHWALSELGGHRHPA